MCGFLEEDEVTLVCLFAEGSAAQGCLVTLITNTDNTTNTTNFTTSIIRDSQSDSATGNITVSTSTIAEYQLYAQDIEEDGSFGLVQLPGNFSMEQAGCITTQCSSGNISLFMHDVLCVYSK